MADKPNDPTKWETTFFQHFGKPSGVGTSLITRKGRGLMTEDTPGYFYFPPGTTKHQKEEDENVPLSYAKGGKVIKSEKY